MLAVFKKNKKPNKIRTSELPGMSFGSPDVYNQGESRKQDSKYRDVYKRKDRGNRLKPTSKVIIYVGTALAVILSLCIMLFVGVVVTNISTKLIQGMTAEVVAKEVIWDLLFHRKFSLIFYIVPVLVGLLAYMFLEKNWRTENVNAIHTDIDQYESDAYIQMPEELPYNFDVFPDIGAHSDVSPTAILSHMMFSNTQVKKIKVAKKYEKNTVEIVEYDDGDIEEIVHKKGEIILGADDQIQYEEQNMFDIEFQQEVFTESDIPNTEEFRSIRKNYDTSKLLYNPLQKRGKDNVDLVSTHINEKWEFPDYEKQRPVGGYIVDTEPNNTMVMAMTRGNKGQTIIEPTIDMWTREKNLNNIAINDPKGELYVKFYYAASKRGLDVVAFNLINPSRTNIYNPLGYAIEASRQGDNQKVEELVAAIGEVFFPTEKADDPMWPNAANAAFKRSALGLIDFYQEEENEMRNTAIEEGWKDSKLEQMLDEMWGQVTLYNVYQMMTELASRKSSDTNFIHINGAEPSKTKDYLTLFFDATKELPRNALRTSVANQDNSLRAMAGSDKTIASVYGISLTAMLFFADEKISRLTSGRPSQNFDIVGLGFPRRIGVRFNTTYVKNKGLQGQKVVWTAYKDDAFTDKYEGDDFLHETKIDSNGWTYFIFKGIFEKATSYIQLDIYDVVSELRVKTFYFKFKKGYKKSLNARTFVKDPVSKERIIHGGLLTEMVRTKDRKGLERFNDAKSMIVIKEKDISVESIEEAKEQNTKSKDKRIQKPIIMQIEVNYTEKPKAVFFITPPHLMGYAKIILVLLNQMFNMQVDKAYLTKSNQKPLYKTRYMLDEVGNLKSEGGGIPFISTKESIGLAQEQQYTLILQTPQQLRDIYGESIDKILQGNTGNIVYLKSTDDSMLETLEKMGGHRHEAYTDSKTVTQDKRALFMPTDSKVSLTTTMREFPTITRNDLLMIPRNNAIVFGKGNPIWSRNELAMPMAFKIHQNQLADGEERYALDTVPTISNTDEFDVILNKPNFTKMLKKRIAQARVANQVKDDYYVAHGLDKDETIRKNPDELARTLMEEVNVRARKLGTIEDKGQTQNEEFNQHMKEAINQKQKNEEKIYADNSLSLMQVMSVNEKGFKVADSIKKAIIDSFVECTNEFEADNRFLITPDGSLLLEGEFIITSLKQNAEVKADVEKLNRKSKGDVIPNPDQWSNESAYRIENGFYEYAFMSKDNDWRNLFNAKFDKLCGDNIRKEEK